MREGGVAGAAFHFSLSPTLIAHYFFFSFLSLPLSVLFSIFKNRFGEGAPGLQSRGRCGWHLGSICVLWAHEVHFLLRSEAAKLISWRRQSAKTKKSHFSSESNPNTRSGEIGLAQQLLLCILME
jgi:hypothetical protein